MSEPLSMTCKTRDEIKVEKPRDTKDIRGQLVPPYFYNSTFANEKADVGMTVN